MKVRIKYKSNIIEIPDVKKCEGIKKYTGLMLNRTNALLFEFSKPGRYAIHSLFCPKFLAIWINNGKIVEYKLVKPWQFIIKPDGDFTKLIEIPINNKYLNIIAVF